MKAGDKIKLKSSIFPKELVLNKSYGSLGYPGVLRDWSFVVVELEGEFIKAKCPKVAGVTPTECYLKIDDCEIV
jgi:hypothetical protein